MTYELKKAEDRLRNIRKVQPILAALRTISLGSWQMARNRRAGLSAYTDRLLDLLAVIVPCIAGDLGPAYRDRDRPRAGQPSERTVVGLVVGSERGLCGRYNKALAEALNRYLDERAADAERVELGALGARLVRELQMADIEPDWQDTLSITALPSYSYAYELVSGWLQRYEAHQLDAVDVIYNADRGAGAYAPKTVRLIPPEVPAATTSETVDDPVAARMTLNPIIETDPLRLYVRVVVQWTTIALYRLLIEAALTEHLARFQLLESASHNAAELIDELMLTVQSARRQAITREMQELAISAGLLNQ